MYLNEKLRLTLAENVNSISELMGSVKNAKRQDAKRADDITRMMEEIDRSYSDASLPYYLNLRDTMEDLTSIAKDHGVIENAEPKHEDVLRIAAISALVKCLQIVADAKDQHQKDEIVRKAKGEAAQTAEAAIVKKYFSKYMSENERNASVDWPRKIACGEDLMDALQDISINPVNSDDVRNKASDARRKCETLLYSKLSVNPDTVSKKWISSKDRVKSYNPMGGN